MKHVTSMIVALLGTAALAPAQIQQNGSFGRHLRTAARTVERTVRPATPAVQRPKVVRRGTNASRSGRGQANRPARNQATRNRSTPNRVVRRIVNRVVSGHGHQHGHRHGHQHGHYVTQRERVWVPGYYRMQHVPAQYGWIYDECGHRHWGIVQTACTRRVHVPGHYEWQTRRVWVSHRR